MQEAIAIFIETKPDLTTSQSTKMQLFGSVLLITLSGKVDLKLNKLIEVVTAS